MKKLLTLVLLVSLCLSGCALGNNVSEGENAMTISDFKKDTSLTSIPENSSNLTNLDLYNYSSNFPHFIGFPACPLVK